MHLSIIWLTRPTEYFCINIIYLLQEPGQALELFI